MVALLFSDLTGSLLRHGHPIRFRATGQSMHPTIRDGETIIVEPILPCAVRRGDILLYRGAKGVIAHRVVAIKGVRGKGSGVTGFRSSILSHQSSFFSTQSSSLVTNYSFILRGDASVTCDEPVEPGRVLGRVVSVERNGRCIVLHSPVGRLKQKLRRTASRLKRNLLSKLAPLPEEQTIRHKQAEREMSK